MKKNTPPKQIKEDFRKVYENPLDWCPLFGYIPETNEMQFSKTPMSGRIGIKALKPWQLYFKGELTEEELLKADKNNLDAMGCYKTTCISSYDAAKECKEYIFEARGLWDVNKKFINHKELMPNVKQKSMREKSKMARILFKNIHRLAWNGKPFSRNIESYRPLTSTLLTSGLNIFIRDE